MTLQAAYDLVIAELNRAVNKHPQSFHNPHEGYAVILEELDELWDEIKKQKGGRDPAAAKEAAHVAAMAIRYLLEVIDESSTEQA